MPGTDWASSLPVRSVTGGIAHAATVTINRSSSRNATKHPQRAARRSALSTGRPGIRTAAVAGASSP